MLDAIVRFRDNLRHEFKEGKPGQTLASMVGDVDWPAPVLNPERVPEVYAPTIMKYVSATMRGIYPDVCFTGVW